MSKLKTLPPLERPREKALRHGINHLSNSELLALIIGSGYVGVSALEVAEQLLVNSGGLLNFLSKHVNDISKFKGVGVATALRVAACLEIAKRCIDLHIENNGEVNTEQIFLKYYLEMSKAEQEMVVLVVINNKRKIIYEDVIYRGDQKNVLIDETFICNQVILHRGKSFYVLHNHPNGHLRPSNEDFNATGKLLVQANKMGLILLDHLIISKDGYYSFKYQKAYC